MVNRSDDQSIVWFHDSERNSTYRNLSTLPIKHFVLFFFLPCCLSIASLGNASQSKVKHLQSATCVCEATSQQAHGTKATRRNQNINRQTHSTVKREKNGVKKKKKKKQQNKQAYIHISTLPFAPPFTLCMTERGVPSSGFVCTLAVCLLLAYFRLNIQFSRVLHLFVSARIECFAVAVQRRYDKHGDFVVIALFFFILLTYTQQLVCTFFLFWSFKVFFLSFFLCFAEKVNCIAYERGNDRSFVNARAQFTYVKPKFMNLLISAGQNRMPISLIFRDFFFFEKWLRSETDGNRCWTNQINDKNCYNQCVNDNQTIDPVNRICWVKNSKAAKEFISTKNNTQDHLMPIRRNSRSVSAPHKTVKCIGIWNQQLTKLTVEFLFVIDVQIVNDKNLIFLFKCKKIEIIIRISDKILRFSITESNENWWIIIISKERKFEHHKLFIELVLYKTRCVFVCVI